MSDNNVLITGTPRSGTTLTCHLLNKLPDTVALHEPMKIRELAELKHHEEICRSIKRFCDEQRNSIHTRKHAISKNVDGVVPDNPVGTSRSDVGLRQSIASKGEIVIDKKLSQEFMLVIKHNSAFTAVLEELVKRFPVYAVVRNPLATLAAWSSVDFRVQRGYASAAERLDSNLSTKLAAIDDTLERQIYLLDWFHGQFHRYLPEQSIIRYESVAESGGRALSVVRPEAKDLSEPLKSRNKSKLYDYQSMLRIGERLLNSEGAYWEFYTKESVERLLYELEMADRGRRLPVFRLDKVLGVARNVKAFLSPKVDVTPVTPPESLQRREEQTGGPKISVGPPMVKRENQRGTQRSTGKREPLLEQMPTGGVCAKIDVREGGFSARILEVTRPRELHLIDPWKYEAHEVYNDACYDGRKSTNQEQLDAVYSRVAERFATQVQAGTVVIHRAPSSEAVSAFPDGYFDWIHIDGNRPYELVKLDLDLWAPKVKRGGYITGDDYVEGRRWKGGVKKAVDELASRNNCQTLIIGKQFILEMS